MVPCPGPEEGFDAQHVITKEGLVAQHCFCWNKCKDVSIRRMACCKMLPKLHVALS